MITISAERLKIHLTNEDLSSCYFLSGNDPFLIQESIEAIRNSSIKHGFEEHFNVIIDMQTDWNKVFTDCNSLHLFTKRQTLTLHIPENGPNATIAAHLIKLVSLLHNDILLILRINILTKEKENSTWFKKLSAKAILVTCQTPNQDQLPNWVTNRAKKMNIFINDAAIKLLCYCYEGNLLDLTITLGHLSLLWPSKKLTVSLIKEVINDAARFTALNWVDALLDGKSKRALYILHQLEIENIEIIILLRVLKYDLLTVIYLQHNQDKQPLNTLLSQRCIWKSRYLLFIKALRRLDEYRLECAVHLLVHLILTFKYDHDRNSWLQLKNLSLLLCDNKFPISFANI